MENLLCFHVGNIIGLSVRKVPHLPMCVNLTLCMVINISNLVGLISFGVSLRKLLQFWYQANFHLTVVPLGAAIVPLLLKRNCCSAQ